MDTIIRAKASAINDAQAASLGWQYAGSLEEIEIFVEREDVENDEERNLSDEEICEYYGIDFDNVISVDPDTENKYQDYLEDQDDDDDDL